MVNFILELSIVIGIAAVLTLIGKVIKQPAIMAYLLTGVIVGPLALNLLESTEVVHGLARMGVAFLLFIVGLNLDFRILKDIGKVSALTSLGGIIIVSTLSFLIALVLGFSYTPALYLAAALAFSSTVVVVKILSDKKEIDTLHGRIAVGILLIEDIVASLILMVLPVIGTGDFSVVFLQIGKAAIFIIGVFVFAYFILPRVLKIAATSQEVLFLVSIAWALIVAVFFDLFGFSIEIGALLAGIALASSPFNLEIKGKIMGLRDFFVVLFFVFFGAQLAGPISAKLITQAIIFSAFILVVKPIIIMFLLRPFGFKKRTNFMTGISHAQISEFSLILVLLGFTLGAITQELFSLIILIALITIALSSYNIHYSNKLFKLFSPLLGFFNGRKREIGYRKHKGEYDVFLFGYNRIGFNLLKSFNKAKKKYVVIDYNPGVIKELTNRGIDCIYGDANDPDFLRGLRLSKAKLVIGTMPDLETNLTILSAIKESKKTIFIPTSHHIKDTRKLYSAGATYVIMPHFLGGDFMAHMLLKEDFNKKSLAIQGQKQLRDLQEREFAGHTHPRRDYHGE